MCRAIISLSKITHLLWRDHPFSQRNKKTKAAMGWSLEAMGEGGLDKIRKRGVGNIGVRNPLPTTQPFSDQIFIFYFCNSSVFLETILYSLCLIYFSYFIFLAPKERSFETLENLFYFTLKAFFAREIFFRVLESGILRSSEMSKHETRSIFY